jgi:hypothetical protein
VRSTVYLPCRTGIIAVRAARSPPALRLLWSSGTGGGPPIVAAGLVWTIGQNGTLYGLDPATGKAAQQASIGVPANHFPTPSVGDGLLLAPAAERVVAFTASARGTAATTPVTTPGPAATSSAAASQPGRSGAAIAPGAIAGIVAGGLAVIGGIGWLLRRGRARRTG